MKNKYLKLKQDIRILNYIQKIDSKMSMSSFVFDPFLAKFLAKLMNHGKKTTMLLKFIDSLILIKNITRISPVYILRSAISNVKPLINIKNISRGRRIVYESKFCSANFQMQKAILFLINNSIKLKGIAKNFSFSQRLAVSILNSFFKQGDAYLSVLKNHYLLKSRRYRFLRSKRKNFVIYVKHTKKMKGWYNQNRYSLFRKLQYRKTY